MLFLAWLYLLLFVKLNGNGERSSVGRAPVCGTGCRRFEPDRSPHLRISREGDFLF